MNQPEILEFWVPLGHSMGGGCPTARCLVFEMLRRMTRCRLVMLRSGNADDLGMLMAGGMV